METIPDAVGQAIIEITPDLSRFEADLTRGLQQAVANAQKAATVSLKVDTSAAGNASNIEGSFDKLNKTLEKVSSNLKDAAKALEDLAKNSAKIQAPDVSGFSKFLSTVGSTAQFLSNLSNIISKSDDLIKFGQRLSDVGKIFNATKDQADGFGAKLKLLLTIYKDSAEGTAKQNTKVKDLATNLEDASGKAQTSASTLQKFLDIFKAKGSDQTGAIALDNLVPDPTAVTSKLSSVTNVIKTKVAELRDSFKGTGGTSTLDQGLVPDPTAVTSKFTSVINVIKTKVAELRDSFKGTGGTATLDQGLVPDPSTVTSTFTNVINAVKTKLAELGTVFREARDGGQNFFASLLTTGKSAFSGITSAIGGFIDGVKGIFSGIGTLSSGIGTLGNAFGSVKNFIGNAVGGLKDFISNASLGEIAAGGLAVGGLVIAGIAAEKLVGQLSNLVQQGIQTAAAMQTIKVALKGVFQDTDAEATKTFKDIQQFAAVTPFTTQGLANSVVQLKGAFAGFSATDALSVLKDIAGAAANVGGSEEQVNRVVLAITQIGARGKLSAQDLNQVTQAIPTLSRVAVYDQLAKNLGKTNEEVQRLAETGGVSAKAGISAILSVAENAPGVKGALERQAATFSGALSTVKDNFNTLLAGAFTPLLNAITSIFNKSGDFFSKIQTPLKAFGDAIAQAFKALAPLAGSFITIAAAIIVPLVQLFTIVVQIAAALEGPFAKAEAAVAALFLGVVAPALNFVIKVLGTLAEFLDNTTTFILKIPQAIIPALVQVGEAVVGFVGHFSIVQTVIGKVADIAQTAFGAIVGLAKSIAGFIEGVAKKVIDFAVKVPVLGTALKGIKKDFDESFGAGNTLGAGIDKLGLNTDNATNKIQEFDKATVDLSKDMEAILKKADGFGTVLTQIGKDAALGADGLAKAKAEILQLGSAVLKPLDPFSAAISSAKALKDANQKVTDSIAAQGAANQKVRDIDTAINVLKAKRTALENDTVAKTNEELDALDKIRGIEESIRELQEERAKVIDDEQKRERDFQPTLAKFQDDALSANIKLEEAKFKVADAQKAINDAAKAGQIDDTHSVNLSGLSLDQVRLKLANVRASLAAQKEDAKTQLSAVDAARQKETLANNLTQAQIDQRQAQRDVVNLQQQQADFLTNSTIAQREYNQKIADLANQEDKLNRDKQSALTEHNKLLNGEIGIKAQIRDITKQITDQDKQRAEAEKAVTAAANATKDAQLAASEAGKQAAIDAATVAGKTQDVINLTTELIRQKAIAAGLDATSLANLDTNIAKIGVQAKAIGGVSAALGSLNAADLLVSAGLNLANNKDLATQLNDPNSLVSALLKPGSPFRDTLIQLLDQRFTGFAEGGVIERATFAQIGEAGREVVLPLTRPWRMADLLSRADVLHPVLAALPKVSFGSTGALPLFSSPGAHHSNLSPAQERDKERKALAYEIAEALAAKGFDTSPHVEVSAPVTIQSPGISQIQERAIVNRIMKEIEKRF